MSVIYLHNPIYSISILLKEKSIDRLLLIPTPALLSSSTLIFLARFSERHKEMFPVSSKHLSIDGTFSTELTLMEEFI